MPTVAVNVALEAPAATVTLPGAVTLAFPLDSDTANPPVAAAPVRLTVQVALPGAVTELGLQLRLLNCATGLTVTDAVRLTPPADAVTVTVCAEVTVAAVRVKVALEAPDATVTVAGMESAALLLDRFTTKPVPEAALSSATVQVVDCPDVRLLGLQLTDCSTGGATTLRLNVREIPAAVAVNTTV